MQLCMNNTAFVSSSHTRFGLEPKSMTSDELERPLGTLVQ